MTDIPIIPRNLLAKHFGGDQRMIAAFEEMNTGAAETQAVTSSTIGATEALQDATVVVLSANGTFTNEYVLGQGNGIKIETDAGIVSISIDSGKVVMAGLNPVVLLAPSSAELTVPTTGTLISDKVVPTLGNYANDAAAAAGGVAVGALYRNGSVIQVRVV